QSDKLQDNFQVCPYCDHHFRLSAIERLGLLIDEGSYNSFGDSWCSSDPLEFVDKAAYRARLEQANQHAQGDSCLAGTGKILGNEVAIAIMNFQFMGGSMGVVAGEKVASVMDYAYQNKVP